MRWELARSCWRLSWMRRPQVHLSAGACCFGPAGEATGGKNTTGVESWDGERASTSWFGFASPALHLCLLLFLLHLQDRRGLVPSCPALPRQQGGALVGRRRRRRNDGGARRRAHGGAVSVQHLPFQLLDDTQMGLATGVLGGLRKAQILPRCPRSRGCSSGQYRVVHLAMKKAKLCVPRPPCTKLLSPPPLPPSRCAIHIHLR